MQKNNIIHTPGFKIAVMAICIAMTAITLNQYAQLIQHLITIKYGWRFELCMIIGMLFFQYPFIYKKSRGLKLDYYFNMLLVSLIGSVLIFPLLALNFYSTYSDTFNLLYFFTVVLIMFFDHKRRVAALELPVVISYTWVLYRAIILIFILT
jgi:hypothetical protein